MAGQSGNSGNGASPPFATKDGKPVNQGSTGGGNDFLTNPGGTGPKGGGKDFIAEGNRPQKPVTANADPTLNPASVPAGGKTLLADPGKVSKTVSGDASPGPKGAAPPFKGLK
jgi:hypothetical protein